MSAPFEPAVRPLDGKSIHWRKTTAAATTHPFESLLPSLSHGEGLLATTFHTYQPVAGPAPTRSRTDGNPLNPKQYLLHLNQT